MTFRRGKPSITICAPDALMEPGSVSTPPCANSYERSWGETRNQARPSLKASRSKPPVRVGERGYDGGKKINGRKRHLLVHTLGLVLRARVARADMQDRAAVPLVLAAAPAEFLRIEHVWLD